MAATIETSGNNVAVEKDKNNSSAPIIDTAKRYLDMFGATGVALPHAKQPQPLPENGGFKIFVNMKGE